MSDSGKIENISDTARWVAVYRARETERPDAVFRDPLAGLLAGEKGQAIVRALPDGENMSWVIVTRTAVFDELILKTAARGVDCVLNLAAGLDTRPYRLDLPPSLRWIEADLPGILAYKEEKLAGQQPRCRLERRRVDLLDPDARRALFSEVGREQKCVLVITEGLLVYLPEDAVKGLGADLAAQPSFRWWLFDHAKPLLLKMLEKRMNPHLKAGKSEMRFAAEDHEGFFGALGWRLEETRYPIDEARRIRRPMPWDRMFRLMSLVLPKRRLEPYRAMSTYLLFGR